MDRARQTCSGRRGFRLYSPYTQACPAIGPLRVNPGSFDIHQIFVRDIKIAVTEIVGEPIL
jgi:hypothetical protein